MTVSADTVRIAIVREEGTPPAPPATPAFKLARFTGESIAFVPTTTQSNELDPSGQVRDTMVTGGASTGAINFELSNHDAFEEYLAGIFGADWAADELIPGTNLFLYLLEKAFQNIPTAGEFSYHRFNNSAFVGGTIAIAPGTPVTGTADINGGPQTLDTAALAGATYPDPGTEPVLVPQDVVVTVGGWSSTACFGNVTITFANGTRGIECIGTLGEKEKVRGRFTAAVAATCYYATDAPIIDLLDQNEIAALVQLNAADGTLEYEFEFPRCKITAAPVTAPGTGQDVVLALQIAALYDATAGYTCKVIAPGRMNPFIEFESDPAEREGIPVVVRSRKGAGEMRFIVRRAGGANRAFRYALHFHGQRLRAELSQPTDTPAQQVAKLEIVTAVMQEAYADAVIIGWEGVDGPSGQPLEFNRANLIDLLHRCPDIWDELENAAIDVDRFRSNGAGEDGAELGKP